MGKTGANSMHVLRKFATSTPSTAVLDRRIRCVRSIRAHGLLTIAGGHPNWRDEFGVVRDSLRDMLVEAAIRRGAQADRANQRQGSEGLIPWREVVTPHRDVRVGRVSSRPSSPPISARCALGRGGDEYGEPERVLPAHVPDRGASRSLLERVERLRGEGGDPVVELQTNFGGGKTHSLIALYHLAGGIEPATCRVSSRCSPRRASARRRSGAARGAGGHADRTRDRRGEGRRHGGADDVG